MDIEEKLASLTLEEKVRLVAGESDWRTHEIPGKVPMLKVSDGPNGIRGDGGVASASFPVGVCMASTWNPDLILRVGKAIAQEAISKDVDVVLGPTINIQRTPIGGRNFECYSEDPLLSGELAAAFTNGVQGEGVGACLKHYICNDVEFERMTVSAEVDEVTLREIYLRPFEIAFRKSDPWTVMAAYNRIHGIWACSHDELVNGVLKNEWGFEGLVMSDWYAARETVANALGGLDLEMPGPAITWGDKLLTAVQDGSVPEDILDDKVRRLLRVLDWTGKFDDPIEVPEKAVDNPFHREIAYQAAAEGMVLLKNDGVLPFVAEDIKTLAVIGPNAKEYRIMGGGSSSLKPHYISDPINAFSSLLDATIDVHPGCQTQKYVPAPARDTLAPVSGSEAQGLLCEFYVDAFEGEAVRERVIARSPIMLNGMTNEAGEPLRAMKMSGVYTAPESGSYTFGLLSTGQVRLFIDDELAIDNWDDRTPGDAFFLQGSAEKRLVRELQAGQELSLRYEFLANPENTFSAVRYGILPPQPEDPIADAVIMAAKADAVVLLVGTNDDWETEGNDREMLSLPGAQDELIERVVAANPNTVVVNNSGSPVAMPWVEEAPAIVQTWFAGQEFGNALADILFGKVNPSGKLPLTFPVALEDTPAFNCYPGQDGKLFYDEGLFVGYRWYSSKGIEPLFPFGFGLSYSDFQYDGIEITAGGPGEVVVVATVSNVGKVAGKETLQIYLQHLESPERPVLELKGFYKVHLEPGESKEVELTLDPASFAHWDVATSEWLVNPGRFKIMVGSSSAHLPHEAVVKITP